MCVTACLLSAVDVKMMIIHEIQHVLAGPMLKQRHFHTADKIFVCFSSAAVGDAIASTR
jgi:hypothetical protein